MKKNDSKRRECANPELLKEKKPNKNRPKHKKVIRT
jgi:hypothetical protein